MGRRGSQIIPFLMEGLATEKYVNLKMENPVELIFSILLPRKTKKMNAEDEQILKDWRAFKKQPYIYTKAKQAVERALKTSSFLQKIPSHGGKSIYRMLNESEIKEKKRLRKATAVKKYSDSPSVDNIDPPSVDNIDPPSVDNIDPPLVDNIDPPLVDNIDPPLVDNIDPPSVDNIEPPSVDNIDPPSVDNIEPPSVDNTDSLKVENTNPPSVDQDTLFVSKVDPPSVGSSGYSSGVDSPASTSSQIMEEDWDMKHAIPFPQHDHDFLHESSFVNPNDILIDLRNTRSSDFNSQIYGSEAMEVDNTKQVLDPYEQNSSPVKFETGDSATDAIIVDNYLGSDTLEDAFAEIPLCNSSGSDELDELMKSVGCSLISNDHNLEALEKALTKVYRFKESKILVDGEMWIFDPEVVKLSPFNGNESDPNSPRMILGSEQFQIMQSCCFEVYLLYDRISVFLKRKHIGNL